MAEWRINETEPDAGPCLFCAGRTSYQFCTSEENTERAEVFGIAVVCRGSKCRARGPIRKSSKGARDAYAKWMEVRNG